MLLGARRDFINGPNKQTCSSGFQSGSSERPGGDVTASPCVSSSITVKCSCAIPPLSIEESQTACSGEIPGSVSHRTVRRGAFENVSAALTFGAKLTKPERFRWVSLSVLLRRVMSQANATENKSESTIESSPQKKSNMEDTKYLPQLLAEKDSLDSSFTHAMKLITAGKVGAIVR